MPTITIPKKLAGGDDLVVLPRKEYEALLGAHSKKQAPATMKRAKSFHIPAKHKKFYDEVDKRLAVALREVADGKTIGSFDNADDLMKSLRSGL